MTQTTRPHSAADVEIDLSLVPPDAETDAADLARYTVERDTGVLPDEDFRRIRLNNGIYGIRGEERLHMVRVKVPQGLLTPAQLRVLAKVSETFSRGYGHITTRQCFQFHMVSIENVPAVMRWLSTVGLTTREACGDTVRNVQGDHLAGIGPDHLFDVTPWSRYMTYHFLRNPAFQRFPRKFKINFSGSTEDLGQALINDIGAIAAQHPETGELGFRIFVGGGLGATPHEAKLLEPFTSFADMVPTFEAIARVFDRAGNRKNRNRARLKWVVDEIGIEALREKVFAERRAVIAVHAVNTGIPDEIIAAGAHVATERRPLAELPPLNGNEALNRWVSTNALATTDGKFAAYATAPIGDLTTAQFLALADIAEDFGGEAPHADLRTTNRQNLVFRGIEAGALAKLWQRLDDIGLGGPDAHAAGDPVSCPGADTCNLAITQSRGLAKAIRERLAAEGLGGLHARINISGCSNSCGQHHLADIGFFGLERRVGDDSAPGYHLLVGGGLGDEGARFGTKVSKIGAKAAPDALVALLRRFEAEQASGEEFKAWAERVGAESIEATVAPFNDIPPVSEAPDAYVDWDETTPFKVELGQGECA